MESIKDKIFKLLHLDNLIDNASGYVEAKFELYKMEIREDVAKLLSKTLIYMTIGFFGFLLLIFFSLGLAVFLNHYFGDTYIGFWIVSGMYGVVFLFLLLFRKTIDRNFEKHFIDMIKRKQK